MRISDNIQFGFLVAFLREDHRASVVCLRARGAANQTCGGTHENVTRMLHPISTSSQSIAGKQRDEKILGTSC